MSKTPKRLARFGEVASSAMKPVQQHKKAAGEQRDAKVSDVLDAVVNRPKPPAKRHVSFYIDEEMAVKLDAFGREQGKGAKSELVNGFLRRVFG